MLHTILPHLLKEISTKGRLHSCIQRTYPLLHDLTSISAISALYLLCNICAFTIQLLYNNCIKVVQTVYSLCTDNMALVNTRLMAEYLFGECSFTCVIFLNVLWFLCGFAWYLLMSFTGETADWIVRIWRQFSKS